MPTVLRVWSVPVRALHWALAGAVLCASLTDEASLRWHERAGYVALGCVVARCAWGLLGSGYARFAQFVPAPREVWRYATRVLQGTAPRHIGHNPLGGWMAIALLALTAAVCVTGALYTLDALWGLAWLEWLHRALAWVLIGCVGLHLAGVAYTSWRHRENLVAAMLTGRKAPPAPDDVS